MSHLFTGVNHNVTNFNETQMGEIFGQSIFNVKAYGASGVGQQDDGTEIQYAIDAAQAVGGIVYFPPGVYKYGTTLNITGRVRLVGGGEVARWTGDTMAGIFQLSVGSGVSLQYSGATDGVHIYNDTDNLVLSGVTIENIELRPSTKGGGRYGIYLDSSDTSKCSGISNLTFSNVAVQYWGTDGIYSKGTSFDISFDRLSALENVRYGVHIDSTSAQLGSSSQITFNDPWMYPSNSESSWCIYTNGVENVRLFGGTLTGYGSGNGAWFKHNACIFGTNIEGAGAGAGIGVRYRGSTSFILEGGYVQSWATGVQIGDPNDKAQDARGWAINADISNNTTDLHIVDGGERDGVLLNHGYANATFTVVDDHRTADGVFDNWFYVGNRDGLKWTNGDSIVHGSLVSGFTVNANWTLSDGTWNGGHLILGTYHLWVDATGDLRIKDGAPSSGTDGAVVGGQS